MKLCELAHSRTGDKGDMTTLSLFAYDEKNYALLEKQVTAEAVKAHFKGIVQGTVTRYDLPQLHAFNFVLEEALSGGVTRSLALDAHGKSLSSLLLEMVISLDS
jgi:hypothetical protein